MSFFSLFGSLAMPVSVLAFASLTTLAPSPASGDKTAPDSTLTIPIEVVNKDRLPTVVIEKEVSIPEGYTYLNHSLSLVSAFPVEGTEQGADWIAGPDKSWSIYVKREINCKQPERIVLRATAAPGPKNSEIGVQAILSVGIKRVGRVN
ncbi:hypothetical protein GGR92_005012 [Spirosoma lacussanchae]|uniref:hypothetical protein n=1 Tax=Spirosoma lacussanchae TaxID=1884249 RepID=UPI0011086E76|nr:hypothetical protein [Spirosoma lacussanchae]